MAFTYDPTTDAGRVRLMTGDTSDAAGYDFEDAEIDAALAVQGSVHGAAAMLLRSLAANAARLAVRITRGGLTDDRVAVARELRETARSLEEQGSAATPLEAVLSPSWDDFSYTENVVNGREDVVRT